MNEKFKQFLIPLLLLLAAIVALILFTPKIIENVQGYKATQIEIETKTQTLKDKQAKLDEYRRKEAEEKKKEQESEANEKPFYKPIMEGLDTEAVIAGEFAEILQLVRENKIKVRAIKYDYDPSDDNFVKGAGEKYNVARLNMEMIANYTSYRDFLRQMYKHSHFLDIQSVEIVPYKKNKRILLINFKVKLYAKK